ncbi:MAG: NADH-dependent alcohol dehydrogenase, partial [Phascolarctobacterium sp.]|nr:NADH-dependent alcohol dehydrogenase [Phascolarctobacterium sp.]
IAKMEEFFRSIDMPTSIGEMGIELTEENIEELAYKCSFKNTRTLGKVKVLNMEDMANIYRAAK